MPVTLTDCQATINSITIFFSEKVNQTPYAADARSALNPANYTVYDPASTAFSTATQLTSASAVISPFGDSAVSISFANPPVFNSGDWVVVSVSNLIGLSGPLASNSTIPAIVDGKNPLRLVDCVAAPRNVAVYFSEHLDTSQLNQGIGTDPNLPSNYNITQDGIPIKISSVSYEPTEKVTLLGLSPGNPLQEGKWILVTVTGVASKAGVIGNGGNNTFSARVGGGPGGRGTKGELKEATRSVEDAVAYPLLTEQVSFPSSGGGLTTVSSGSRAATLDSKAALAIGDVLGWKVNQTDPRGFVGALTQAFTLNDVEGHTEATWNPRTYAVQTDLGGGISGAQASLYTRAKDAVQQSQQLLDGLYPLDPDADPEYVKALREMAKSQMNEILLQFGVVGGPSILRVNTYFEILLGQSQPSAGSTTIQYDPDRVQGTLGQLRDTYGIYFVNNPFLNSIEDEQDITNFRVISDYLTSLLQSWISNQQFFQLGTLTPAFFGTQLVLLSRQFSVIAETLNEVRFALESVFIGPSERQTLLLQFDDPALPAMFIEDILQEIEDFVTGEGPRLLQDGGKISVKNNILPVVKKFQRLVQQSHRPINLRQLPDGYRTVRVQRSIDDLHDQLKSLIELSIPVQQSVPPPGQEPQEGVALLNVNPNSAASSSSLPVTLMGAGLKPGVQAVFLANTIGAPVINVSNSAFLSQNLAVAQINIGNLLPGDRNHYTYDVGVTNPDGRTHTLRAAFTVSGSPAYFGPVSAYSPPAHAETASLKEEMEEVKQNVSAILEKLADFAADKKAKK